MQANTTDKMELVELSELTNKRKANDIRRGFTTRKKRHVLVAGDFNLPDIGWSNRLDR